MNWKYIHIMEKRDYSWDNDKHAFYDVEPYYAEKLWSDWVVIPDQRYNLDSLIELAYNYMKEHENITKMEFFEIREWNYDNYKVLYKNY